MELTIQTFLRAISEIQERDYNIPPTILEIEERNFRDDQYRTYENNFVTKLNENYAVLAALKKIMEPKELNRQLQIPKNYIFTNNPLPGIKDGYEKLLHELGDPSEQLEELKFIPDFIIHKDQGDRDPLNQKFIAEVKTERNLSYKKFVWDFFKLNIYMEDLNYQTAAFLSVNTASDRIFEYVSNYVSNVGYYTRRVDSLYIINKRGFHNDA